MDRVNIKFTEEMKEEAVSMRNKGLSYRKIAEYFDCATATIYFHLNPLAKADNNNKVKAVYANSPKRREQVKLNLEKWIAKNNIIWSDYVTDKKRSK